MGSPLSRSEHISSVVMQVLKALGLMEDQKRKRDWEHEYKPCWRTLRECTDTKR